MSDVISEEALDYLSPPPGAFWQWAEEARVICWREGGQTIAFRSELETMLAALAPQGLPPMGAVLLLLAACLPSWNTAVVAAPGRRAGLLPQPKDMPDWNTLVRAYGRYAVDNAAFTSRPAAGRTQPLRVHLDQVIESLTRLNSLPADLRTGAENRAELAKLLFDPVEVRLSREASASVIDAFRFGFPAEAVAAGPEVNLFYKTPAVAATDTIMALFQAICLAPISEERLRLLRRTGLDTLPSPADVELPIGQLVSRLLRDLKQDADLGGVAKLACDLLAVVHLPRRVSDPEDLPVGGLSDISHRGSLDRLLPGELAHDDLTLTVRIALNEALYYRRESLLRNPVGQRRILLDSGIRMWGVPRVFAAAVGLALAATVSGRTQVEAFRATREGIAPVDLRTREGIVALLEGLDSHAHPGKALATFLPDPTGTDPAADSILITHEDVLADPAFGQELARLIDRPIYLVTVNGEGSYRLWGCSGLGQRLIRQAKLDLSAVLGGEKDRRAAIGSVLESISRKHDPSLPVILSTQPFPLRLPAVVDWKKCVWREDVGLLSFTSDRRLMLWDRPSLGPRQIADCLPSGSLYWMAMLDEHTACLLLRKGNKTVLSLALVDLASGGCTCHEIEAEAPMPLQGVILLSGLLCLIGRQTIRVFDIAASRRLEDLALPSGVRWDRGRYFRCTSLLSQIVQTAGRGLVESRPASAPSGPRLDSAEFSGQLIRDARWFALNWDGQRLSFHPFDVPEQPSTVQLAVFDREEMDGPWVLYSSGQLRSLADDSRINLPDEYTGHVTLGGGGISPDGHSVCVLPQTAGHCLRINLRDGQVKRYSNLYDAQFGGARNWASSAPNLRHKIHKVTRIGKISDGGLCLVGRNGPAVVIDVRFSGANGLLRVSNLSLHGPDVQRLARVQPCNRPKGVNYSLAAATWSDGSKAWLDSRGLLHLRSAHPSVPEVSIVLIGEGSTAAWASDGVTSGPRYFVGDSPTVPGDEFFKRIQEFTSRLP